MGLFPFSYSDFNSSHKKVSLFPENEKAGVLELFRHSLDISRISIYSRIDLKYITHPFMTSIFHFSEETELFFPSVRNAGMFP